MNLYFIAFWNKIDLLRYFTLLSQGTIKFNILAILDKLTENIFSSHFVKKICDFFSVCTVCVCYVKTIKLFKTSSLDINNFPREPLAAKNVDNFLLK